MYYELFFYCIITSMVAVGFYEATEPGQILYQIKEPVLKLIDSFESAKLAELSILNQEQEIATSNMDEYYKKRRDNVSAMFDRKKRFVTNIYKPIFLCTRCMASLFSEIIWFPLTGYNYGFDIAFYFLIPAILIGVVINAIISQIIH